MKKILLTNLILILLLFIIAEGISYGILYNKYKNDIKEYNHITGHKSIFPLSYQKVTQAAEGNLFEGLRPEELRDKNKRPIILFGCSYTYGYGLNENQTFSRKLADYTGRTVINRGRSGTGIPFMYFQLTNPNIIEKLPKDAEYIIFTLIPDHFPRLFRYRNFVLTGDHTLRYKIQNDKLVMEKLILKPLHSLFTAILLEEYIAEQNYKKSLPDNALFTKLINESHKIIKNKFPNSKFVILYYKYNADEQADNAVRNYTKNNKDIILIEADKEAPEILKDQKYWLSDNIHPSEEAWDIIIPIIAKKLNIDAAHH